MALEDEPSAVGQRHLWWWRLVGSTIGQGPVADSDLRGSVVVGVDNLRFVLHAQLSYRGAAGPQK